MIHTMSIKIFFKQNAGTYIMLRGLGKGELTDIKYQIISSDHWQAEDGQLGS